MLLAFRTSVQESTRFTPFFLNHGREARLPLETLVKVDLENPIDPTTYAAKVQSKLQEALEMAKRNKEQVQHKNQINYDKSHKMVEYFPGDEVWVNVKTKLKKGLKKKFALKWEGPACVVRRQSAVNYIVDVMRGDKKKRQMVHVSRITKFIPRQPNEEKQLNKVIENIPHLEEFQLEENLTGEGVEVNDKPSTLKKGKEAKVSQPEQELEIPSEKIDELARVIVLEERYNKEEAKEYLLQVEGEEEKVWVEDSRVPWHRVIKNLIKKARNDVRLITFLAEQLQEFYDMLGRKPTYSITKAKKQARQMLGWESTIRASHIKRFMENSLALVHDIPELVALLATILADFNNRLMGAWD